MAAVSVELLDLANRMFEKANTEKGKGRPRRPIKVPRPWRPEQERGPKKQSSPEEIARFFGMSKGRVIVTGDETAQDGRHDENGANGHPEAGEPVPSAPGPGEGR